MIVYTAPDLQENPGATSSRIGSMDSKAPFGGDILPSIRSLEDRQTEFFYLSRDHTSTPSSSSASPSIKPERLSISMSMSSSPCNSRGGSPLPSISYLSIQNNPSIRLPSLSEFDMGVEALVKSQGPACPQTPPSPLLNVSRPALMPLRFNNFAPTPSYQNYSINSLHGGNGAGSMHGYPSSSSEGENRHINQKYTQEEGDFIIYAWHDKKLKWQRIKQEFAAMFGRTPERTVQGLQAWYYRMNQRIPVWDHNGWLIFDNEDDLEPRQVSIKCRDKDGQDKPMEPLGLGQRYPERAIHYAWVDPELKRKSRDWAMKRERQYRDRKERRKRKEQRRLKL